MFLRFWILLRDELPDALQMAVQILPKAAIFNIFFHLLFV